MPNTFSKPTDKGQRTIDIYKAETAQGVFSGWGLSSLQQMVSLDCLNLSKTWKPPKKWFCPCCKSN